MMKNSIWAENIKLPTFESLKRDIKTDVLIIGGGIAGILCAYALQQAGADYTLIEADRICGGVSRNTTAKITSQHGLIYDKIVRQFDTDTARLYFEANEAALERYRQMCRDIPCDFEEKDNYVYSVDSPKKLEKEMETLQKIGAPAELVSKLPIPIETASAVKFASQAQFDPLKFIAHIAKDLNIYERTPAHAFEGTTVISGMVKIRAKKIIMATHFPLINKHGWYFLKMYQHRSYVLALEGAQDVGGMYVDEAEDGLSFRNYKNFLLLGGGSHRTGKQGGGWEELRGFAKTKYPNVQEKYRWATQDCMTLDGMPYIGRYSKNTPDLFVATGFNKWGMTSAMAASSILCDLVQGKGNKYAEIFSPSRTILRPQLLINAAEATANLLTISKPRCPHLGCALKWNEQERSWDCSCHGSRFAEDGTLLDNPATGNLPKWE